MIFTSDNGLHNEGGHDHKFFNSNGDLTGYKRSMHEGGIRVPMIARWPGKIAAGAVSDHPSGFCDFLQTACELAGVEPPGDIDGISYVPTLLGHKEQQRTDEYIFTAPAVKFPGSSVGSTPRNRNIACTTMPMLCPQAGKACHSQSNAAGTQRLRVCGIGPHS